MDQDMIAPNDVIGLAGALLKLLCREYPDDLRGFENELLIGLARPGTAGGSDNSPFMQSENVDWNAFSSGSQQDELPPDSPMTIACFVENKFIPEHVALKGSSGQAHYKSMLKHVLRPEEVERMYRGTSKGTRKKLKAVPGWPYLSDVRLCDAQSEDVSRLISAAMVRGYSIQTAIHIRNVASAIFSHAKQERLLLGDNPASLVRPPEFRRKRTYPLTLEKAQKALSLLESPAREITFLSIFAGMSFTEILGLQWKFVNLSEESYEAGTSVAPRTIAVRNQLYRGRLECVKKNRLRNLPIPERLLQILLKLRSRGSYVGPDDFVFVSQVGTPVNQNNLLTRKIRPIAKQLGVPSVSCQAFRRIRTILVAELGMQQGEPEAMMASSFPARDLAALPKWRCPSRRGRLHSKGDFSPRSSFHEEISAQ